MLDFCRPGIWARMRAHTASPLQRGQKCFISLKILCSTRIAASSAGGMHSSRCSLKCLTYCNTCRQPRSRCRKDDIIQAVWGGRIVSEFALTSRINATRTAVGDNGDRQRLIRTLPRKGIRFVGLVQERALPVEEAPVASSVLDPETSGRTAAGWDRPKSAERRQLTIASCELLLGAENAVMTRRI